MKKLLCVLAIVLAGCATTDEHPFVQAMSSDAAAIGCQAADAVSTYVVLSKVSGVHEANPLMAGVIKTLGWPGFFAVKLALALFMTSDSINPTVAAAVNTATCGVAISNIAVGAGVLK